MNKPDRKFWIIVAAAWLLLGLLYSIQSYHYRVTIGRPGDLLPLLINDIGFFFLWALFSVPVIRWILHWPILRSNWQRRLPVFLMAGLVIAFSQKGLYDAFLLVAYGETTQGFPWERWYRSVIGSFELGFFIYVSMIFVVHTWIYHVNLQREQLDAAALRERLSQIRLQVLQSQLQPHFLFNTLNTISGLIDVRPADAKLTLGRLGELLRMSLESDQLTEVTLQRELDFSQVYMAIQTTRFGDRLTYKCTVDSAMHGVLVPTMMLQPLLENAVTHGVSKVPGAHTIELKSWRDGDTLCLDINNSFEAIGKPEQTPGLGIGLTNIRERLRQLYGEKAKCELAVHAHGAHVTIRMPWRTSDGNQG